MSERDAERRVIEAARDVERATPGTLARANGLNALASALRALDAARSGEEGDRVADDLAGRLLDWQRVREICREEIDRTLGNFTEQAHARLKALEARPAGEEGKLPIETLREDQRELSPQAKFILNEKKWHLYESDAPPESVVGPDKEGSEAERFFAFIWKVGCFDTAWDNYLALKSGAEAAARREAIEECIEECEDALRECEKMSPEDHAYSKGLCVAWASAVRRFKLLEKDRD